MMPNDGDEIRLAHLARLPILAPDAKRAERTRRRCRAMLRRQHGYRTQVLSRIETARTGRGTAVGVFCAFVIVYLSELVATTLRVQGLLR